MKSLITLALLAFLTVTGAAQNYTGFDKVKIRLELVVSKGPAIFNPGAAGNVGVIVKGHAGQTADLMQWQDSTGALLASVDKFGWGYFERFVINGQGTVGGSLTVVGGIASDEPIDVGQTNGGRIRFYEPFSGGNYIGLTVDPAGLAANVDYQLPTARPTVDGQLLSATNANPSVMTWVTRSPGMCGFSSDGGASVLTTGVKSYFIAKEAGTIIGWKMICKPSGSVAVKIYKDAYNASALPSTDISSGASAPLSISAAVANKSSVTTGWGTTSIAVDDCFAFEITSATTATYVTFELIYTAN